MKHLILVFIALIVMFGCESTPKTPTIKTLDWNKTIGEQELEIGDTIIVEGLAYDIVEYFYTSRNIYPKFTDPPSFAVHVPSAIRKAWVEEISIPVYNPEQPDVTKNPNVPIGSVVCIIFNPKHEEDLMALHDMYPPVIEQETAEQAYKLAGARARYLREYSTEFTGRQKLLHFQHRFRFTGTIRDFSRKTLQSVSLQCIDFVVSDIDVISSELLNELEDWRTEVSLMAPTIVDDD